MDHVVTMVATMVFGSTPLTDLFPVSVVTVTLIMPTLITQQLLIKNTQSPEKILMNYLLKY